MMRGFAFFLYAFAFLMPLSALAQDTVDPFTACNVEGSTTLYHLEKDTWLKTDEADASVRSLPASTFKIFHSLIALDTGATTPDEVFKWDGTHRQFSVWNQDTAFPDAFKNSTVWVYEELARRMDVETYARYLKEAGYFGNGSILNGRDGNFWVYGDWGISPEEQIKMLVKLYKNELPFSASAMETVKGFMKEGDTYGKTGWTQDGQNQIGWWIGYTTRGSDTVFFATRLRRAKEKGLKGFLACRKSITDEILAGAE